MQKKNLRLKVVGMLNSKLLSESEGEMQDN